jgi:phospholipid-binding lipoprotein MlaA
MSTSGSAGAGAVCGVLFALAGCASSGSPALTSSAEPAEPPAVIEPDVVSYPDPSDPLEPLNRLIFAFNDAAYRFVLVPVSRRYLDTVPEPARRSLGNFFGNLRTPVYLLNHLVQLDFAAARHDVQRFGINTTLGVLGFRDPAGERFGVDGERTGFSDTLSRHGASHGPYLTLPFVGPSDVRSGAGLVADWLLNPIRFLTDNPATLGVQSVDYLQDSATRADAYPELRAKSNDPYVFFRNLHLEGVQRDADYP